MRQSRSPQELAEEVGFWTEDFPPPTAVVPLREALDKANSRWIDAFRDADGISNLCMVRWMCPYPPAPALLLVCDNAHLIDE